jgi:hypothetical protein
VTMSCSVHLLKLAVPSRMVRGATQGTKEKMLVLTPTHSISRYLIL